MFPPKRFQWINKPERWLSESCYRPEELLKRELSFLNPDALQPIGKIFWAAHVISPHILFRYRAFRTGMVLNTNEIKKRDYFSFSGHTHIEFINVKKPNFQWKTETRKGYVSHCYCPAHFLCNRNQFQMPSWAPSFREPWALPLFTVEGSEVDICYMASPQGSICTLAMMEFPKRLCSRWGLNKCLLNKWVVVFYLS